MARSAQKMKEPNFIKRDMIGLEKDRKTQNNPVAPHHLMYLRVVLIERVKEREKKLREGERNSWRRERDKTKHAFM